jgi:hypothetical protein
VRYALDVQQTRIRWRASPRDYVPAKQIDDERISDLRNAK